MKIYSLLMGGILTIYFAELVFPPLTVIANSGWVCIICFFIWGLLSYMRDRNFYRYMKTGLFIAILYYLATVFMPYLFENSVIAHRYMTLSLVPLGYLIYTFHVQHYQVKMLSRVLKIIFALAAITEVITLVALIRNPYISRSIKSTVEETGDNLAAQGIGGYSFIYFVTIWTILLIHLCINESNYKKKTVWLSFSILSIVLILKSSYMTAMLILLAEVGTYFLYRMKANARSNGFMFVCLAAFALIVVCLSLMYSEQLLYILPPRIAQIFLVTNGSAFAAILGEFSLDRLPRLMESLDAFIQNPLLGLVSQGEISFEAGYLVGFGQHSFVFDTFALYGVLIGIGAIYSMTLPFHRSEKRSNDCIALRNSVFIGAMILYVLNNATESIGLVVGIIYPFVRDKYRREHSNE